MHLHNGITWSASINCYLHSPLHFTLLTQDCELVEQKYVLNLEFFKDPGDSVVQPSFGIPSLDL